MQVAQIRSIQRSQVLVLTPFAQSVAFGRSTSSVVAERSRSRAGAFRRPQAKRLELCALSGNSMPGMPALSWTSYAVAGIAVLVAWKLREFVRCKLGRQRNFFFAPSHTLFHTVLFEGCRADADLRLLSKSRPPLQAFAGQVVWIIGASQVELLHCLLSAAGGKGKFFIGSRKVLSSTADVQGVCQASLSYNQA